MRIYCMSDIHGCMAEFVDALALVWDHLDAVSYTHLRAHET